MSAQSLNPYQTYHLIYYLMIEERFYLTPEARKEVLYFDTKEALRQYRKQFKSESHELKKIIGTGVAGMVDGRLRPAKRMRI